MFRGQASPPAKQRYTPAGDGGVTTTAGIYRVRPARLATTAASSAGCTGFGMWR